MRLHMLFQKWIEMPACYLLFPVTVFRLGKSVDNFRGALQTIHLNNPLLRLLITLTKLNRGLYLLFDHLIWAGRMRLATIDLRYWNRLANRFWLLAIILALLRDLYELVVAIQMERKRLKQYSSSSGTPPSGKQVVVNVMRNNPGLVVDIVKNGSDFCIPASRLDLIYLPSGVVGLLGVISSVAGLLGDWNEQLKLRFS